MPETRETECLTEDTRSWRFLARSGALLESMLPGHAPAAAEQIIKVLHCCRRTAVKQVPKFPSPFSFSLPIVLTHVDVGDATEGLHHHVTVFVSANQQDEGAE